MTPQAAAVAVIRFTEHPEPATEPAPVHPIQRIHEACQAGGYDCRLALRTFYRDGEPWFVAKGTVR